MAETDQLATPVEEWTQLFQRDSLTTELIREFWKESVPRLSVPPPAAPAEDLSAFDERRERLLLQPLSRFLLGDDSSDGPVTGEEGQVAPATSNVCGKVFNNGDPTYSCRDCEQDPTCVLCRECFRQSVHRYHRYQMCVSQGNGGYCDCGDSEAWKGDPACATHQPPAEQRPAPAAPEQAAKATVLLSAAMQYVLSVLDRDATTLKIVPLELDLGREHYPPRPLRYATVAYNFGVMATDKVADTIAQVTPCSPDEAKAAAAALRKEGVAILLYNEITGCDELLKRLKPEQPRKLRRTELHVVHAHVVAHQLFTLRLVRHLRQLLEKHPQLRPVFSSVMQQTLGGSDLMPSVLERLMACDGRQWKQARHESHLLLIQGMLMDIESKKYFAQMFTGRYREQTLAALPNSVQDQITVQDLSVQIYTVPSIAHHLITEQDALSVVLGTLVDEMRTYTHGGQLVLRAVTTDSASRRRFERLLSCLTDARYLLSVVPQTQTDKLRAGVRRGLDTLLELLFFCESMEPVVRAQTAHVMYDTPYELQLTVSFGLAPLVTQVLEWCAADRQLLVYAYSAVLSKLHSRLPPDKYFRRTEVQRFGRRLSVSPLSVMTMPVSLELPLSRLLAGLHLHLAAHGLNYNSAEFAGLEDRVTPAQLLERPLRALVMDAQVQAGLWKRNGRSLEIMCSWYSLSMQVADMRDRDLQVAQICASLMDPDEFVISLLFRHGAADTDGTIAGEHGEALPEDDPEGERREYMDSNMADFLLLLLHVFAERYHPGVGVVTKEECLRYEVIQFLCVKPMTHSQVAKRLPEADSGLLETAVKEVADFATQQDFRGQRTYHIKAEFIHRYTPMWHHFSRYDRSQSEQRLRRLLQQGGESVCLPPPPAPPFQPSLRPARAVLTCDITLQLLLQQLNRMFGSPFVASLELILLRSLFLIGAALNEEEREATSDEPEPFCFSGPAQRVGIVDVLNKLVGNPRVSPHAELLAWVNTKLNGLLGRAATAPDSSQAAAAEDAGGEKKRRRAQAAARRARILGQMQAQRKKFITQNVAALAEPEDTETERAAAGCALAAGRARAGSAMDLSECAGADEWPVCLGPRQSARPAAPAEYTCILCQASEQVSSTRPAMVMAAFVQLSTVLSRDRSSRAANPVLYVPSSLHRLPHTSSCGHAMHAACWQRHFDSVARDRRAHPRVQYLSSFDVQRQEFLCPLCLRLSNTVVPLVPDWTAPSLSPAATAAADDIGVWLSGLLVASGPTVRGDDSADDVACSCCDPDWPQTLTKAISSQMTARESGQFLAVSRLGIPPPDTHMSTREMAGRFFQSAHKAAHLPQPAGGGDRRQIVLQTCVYSLHAAEQLVRATGRPLLAEDSSRAHICLRQVVRVCAALLPASNGLQPARHHCLALLRCLLWPAAGAPTVLDLDAFGVALMLSHGLPTVAARQEEEGLLAPAGSLQELQCVRLSLLLHMVQILLTMDVVLPQELQCVRLSLLLHLVQILLTMDVAELTRQQPMETDGEPAADQDEQQWLAELYTLVRSAAGIEVADVSPPLLRQYVINAVTPFLRCCALYFHFLTGVRAPSELLQPLPLPDQYPHLLRYLGLDSLCLPQATDCHSPVQELVFRWCRQPGLDVRMTELPARVIVPAGVSRLIDLPHEYSDLIIQASSFQCQCDEQQAAPGPALCLVCGALLCSDLSCTRHRQTGRRGMDGHAICCGAGVGVLLVVRRCKLYLLHTSVATTTHTETPRKALHPPPYVDRFCEPDQGLHRRNPLTLQTEQYDKLSQLWLAHGVCDSVTRYLEEYSAGMILD